MLQAFLIFQHFQELQHSCPSADSKSSSKSIFATLCLLMFFFDEGDDYIYDIVYFSLWDFQNLHTVILSGHIYHQQIKKNPP